MARLKIGEILIQEGLVSQNQIEEAIKQQKITKAPIGEVLIQLGMITEENLAAALGAQLLIPYATKDSGLLEPQPDQNLDKIVPQEFSQRHNVLPLSKHQNTLTVAVHDPMDLLMIDNLKQVTNCDINLVIATKTDILNAIKEFYYYDKATGEKKETMLDKAVERTYAPSTEAENNAANFASIKRNDESTELSLDKLIAKAEEAPVIKLVDLIIRQAIDEGASDIHIEPFEEKLEVRYRIDGSLYQIPPPAKHLHLAIVSRVKILAKLDIAEKRLPQDGRISAKLEMRNVDLRVSTIPTVWGEKVVMRILDKDAVNLSLSTLGFDSKQLTSIRRALKSPYGLFFVTGPTGSGKSTTLYSGLSEVLDPTKNILTAEDPVEFRIPGINQVQMRSEIGLTFASALRSFLRQDPDIIMVGEVRDMETAQICVRAALTGHLVLSTLHTNDSASAITRLMDIGIPNYLLTPSLLMVVAQRLARTLCPHCKEAYEPTKEELGDIALDADLIYRAKGCKECNHMGYKGRKVISEVLSVDHDIKNLISKSASAQEIKDMARKNGMMTILESGIKKVEEGITSLDAILGVSMT